LLKSGAVIVVGVADDVFLREGVSGLHFDDLHRFFAIACDAVLNAASHVHVVSVDVISRFVIQSNSGCAAHYNPVLVAVLVALVAETLTGIDHETLDLGVGLIVKNDETAPGSIFSVVVVGHGASRFCVTTSYHHDDSPPPPIKLTPSYEVKSALRARARSLNARESREIMNNERLNSLGSMALSVLFWYLLTQSLPMAIGIILLVFIHEMGHFYAARLKGISVEMPIFTPLGAYVRLSSASSARDEAFVAYAGPLVGGVVSLAVIALAPALGSNLLFNLGVWGVIINLLNLVPLEPLDGGKISLAIERRMYFLGVPIFIYFMTLVGLNMFNMIMAFLILSQSWTAIQYRNQQAEMAPSYFRVPIGQKIVYAGAYLALAGLLTWVALQPAAFLKLLVSFGL